MKTIEKICFVAMGISGLLFLAAAHNNNTPEARAAQAQEHAQAQAADPIRQRQEGRFLRYCGAKSEQLFQTAAGRRCATVNTYGAFETDDDLDDRALHPVR
jgi:hypothetical protein